MHWASKYIGTPWVNLEHDCWEFTRIVQKREFKRALPKIALNAKDVRACVKNATQERDAHWQEVASPIEGDCVLMSQNQQPTHVGVWVDVDGGGILHCVEGAGVIFTRKHMLQTIGFNFIGAYRLKDGA
jgi:hypothetical protein